MFNAYRGTSNVQVGDSSLVRGRGTGSLFTADLALAIFVAITLCVLVLRAGWGAAQDPVTSDESLYLSEAVSIADGRIEYASGEPITHRPPLYPAMLAPAMALTGNSVDAARIVPIALSIGTLAALYWLGRVTVGHRAACAGVALAALAAAPSRLSAAFFVDTAAAMWIFASAAALVRAHRSELRASAWSTLAGLFLALAFLTKETAAVWLSMPIAFAVLSGSSKISFRSLFAFYAMFAALVMPWFAWVAYHTGTAFKLDAAPVPLFAATLILFLTAIGVERTGWLKRERVRMVLAALVIASWAVIMLLVLESRPEPHSRDYLANVSEWTARVFATSVEPWAFVLAAWGYACWYIRVRREDTGPIVAVAAMGAPVYVFVANQGWEIRQVIWLTYLSYLLLGWLTLRGIDYFARGWRPAERAGFAIACVVALGLVAGFASDVGSGDTPDSARDWRNEDQREISDWLDDLPDGATVLSSRLYSSQLYVDSGGRLTIRQLPTLGVVVAKDGSIKPFGTLFRYDEANLTIQRHWLWFAKYAGRPYAAALAEEDLLDDIQRHQATHLLLTGQDAGFSSLEYRGYFDDNPAFTTVRASTVSGAVLYEVERNMLAARRPPLVVDVDDLAYFARATAEAERVEFWEAVAPYGVLVDGEQLRDARQLADLATELNTAEESD